MPSPNARRARRQAQAPGSRLQDTSSKIQPAGVFRRQIALAPAVRTDSASPGSLAVDCNASMTRVEALRGNRRADAVVDVVRRRVPLRPTRTRARLRATAVPARAGAAISCRPSNAISDMQQARVFASSTGAFDRPVMSRPSRRRPLCDPCATPVVHRPPVVILGDLPVAALHNDAGGSVPFVWMSPVEQAPDRDRRRVLGRQAARMPSSKPAPARPCRVRSTGTRESAKVPRMFAEQSHRGAVGHDKN